MESHIVSLLYLAILLLLGILITAVSNRFKVSNILFLVLAGYLLKVFGFDLFTYEFVLVISSLALIMIVLETTMKMDLLHITKNFFHVLKFNIAFFFVTAYSLTLFVFLMFNIPGNLFDVFVLCFLLSIIVYGVDPIISMEFFQDHKNKVKEMLKIEGMISGPVVVVFAFFVIGYLRSKETFFQPGEVFHSFTLIGAQIIFAFLIGIIMAFLFYKFLSQFKVATELSALLIIVVGIFIFVVTEALGANGSLAVAIYAIFLRGLTKEPLPKTQVSILAHILYFMVFILFGLNIFFPTPTLWLKGLGVFIIFLLVRLFCTYIFLRELSRKEMLFFTLNVAKGIEVALVMFIMHFYFSKLPGIEFILSLGFMFFVYSYVLSTVMNRYSEYFLSKNKTR